MRNKTLFGGLALSVAATAAAMLWGLHDTPKQSTSKPKPTVEITAKTSYAPKEIPQKVTEDSPNQPQLGLPTNLTTLTAVPINEKQAKLRAEGEKLFSAAWKNIEESRFANPTPSKCKNTSMLAFSGFWNKLMGINKTRGAYDHEQIYSGVRDAFVTKVSNDCYLRSASSLSDLTIGLPSQTRWELHKQDLNGNEALCSDVNYGVIRELNGKQRQEALQYLCSGFNFKGPNANDNKYFCASAKTGVFKEDLVASFGDNVPPGLYGLMEK